MADAQGNAERKPKMLDVIYTLRKERGWDYVRARDETIRLFQQRNWSTEPVNAAACLEREEKK